MMGPYLQRPTYRPTDKAAGLRCLRFGLWGNELPLLRGIANVSELIELRSVCCPSPNCGKRQSAVHAGEFVVASPNGNNIPLLVCRAAVRPLIDESPARFRIPGDVERQSAGDVLEVNDVVAQVGEGPLLVSAIVHCVDLHIRAAHFRRIGIVDRRAAVHVGDHIGAIRNQSAAAAGDGDGDGRVCG